MRLVIVFMGICLLLGGCFAGGDEDRCPGELIYREESAVSKILVIATTAAQLNGHVAAKGYQAVDSFGEKPVSLLGAWSGFNEAEIAKSVGETRLNRAADLAGLRAYQKTLNAKGGRRVLVAFPHGEGAYRVTEFTVSR